MASIYKTSDERGLHRIIPGTGGGYVEKAVGVVDMNDRDRPRFCAHSADGTPIGDWTPIFGEAKFYLTRWWQTVGYRKEATK